MRADYSPFLILDAEGRISWRLEDALRLAAGHILARDDHGNTIRILCSPSDRVRVSEETLRAAFADQQLKIVRPEVMDRAGDQVVEARAFLWWVSLYLAQTKADVPFPVDLIREVWAAAGAGESQVVVRSCFSSLAAALDGWFDKPLCDLPQDLSDRVRRELWPLPWESLSARQRIRLAKQWDYRDDPATRSERMRWWRVFMEKHEIEQTIARHKATWDAIATPTPGQRIEREDDLGRLEAQLAHLDRLEENAWRAGGDGYPERALTAGGEGKRGEEQQSAPRYIAYPKALRLLRKRFDATPEEVAAWIWDGPSHGGLIAYMQANEMRHPPRFYFHHEFGHDYISPLMACWFREDHIASFVPVERYITGAQLFERWGKCPGVCPEEFVRVKLRESRLLDIHPNFGGTEGSFAKEESAFPPLESGLFALSQVEQIEAEDFGAEEEIEESASGSCQPASADLIRRNFPVKRDPVENDNWWKEKMSEAARYGLLECRVGEAKRGRGGGSLWRPDMIAGWLVDRHTKGKEGLAADDARKGLMRFPGCADIVELMFPQDG